VTRCHELGPVSGTSTTFREASIFPLNTPLEATCLGGPALFGAVVGVTAAKLLTLDRTVLVTEWAGAPALVVGVTTRVVDVVEVEVVGEVVVVTEVVTVVGVTEVRGFDDDVRVKTNTTRRIGLDHITRCELLRD
jgi:hypothetical protein